MHVFIIQLIIAVLVGLVVGKVLITSFSKNNETEEKSIMRIFKIIIGIMIFLVIFKGVYHAKFSREDEVKKEPIYKILVNGFGEYKVQNRHGEDFVRTTSSIQYLDKSNEYVKDTLYGFKNMESEDVVDEEIHSFLIHGHKLHTVIKYTNYNEAAALVDSLVTDYRKHTYTEVKHK